MSWSDRNLFRNTTVDAGKSDEWRKGTNWKQYRKSSFWDNTTFAKKNPILNVDEEEPKEES